jgi:hypothetical protein
LREPRENRDRRYTRENQQHDRALDACRLRDCGAAASDLHSLCRLDSPPRELEQILETDIVSFGQVSVANEAEEEESPPPTHTLRQSLRKPSKRSSPWHRIFCLVVVVVALLLLLTLLVVVVIVPGAHRRVHAAGVVKDPRN